MSRAARRALIVVALACVGAHAGAAQPAAPVEPLRQLIREGRFQEAEAAARRLLAQTEATSGPDSAGLRLRIARGLEQRS